MTKQELKDVLGAVTSVITPENVALGHTWLKRKVCVELARFADDFEDLGDGSFRLGNFRLDPIDKK